MRPPRDLIEDLMLNKFRPEKTFVAGRRADGRSWRVRVVSVTEVVWGRRAVSGTAAGKVWGIEVVVWVTAGAKGWEVEVAQAVVGGSEVKGVAERVPSKAWVEAVMRGAPVLAVPQAAAVVPAEEAVVVVPVEVAAVGAVAVVVGDAGKKRA
jgi:hypothetical protein